MRRASRILLVLAVVSALPRPLTGADRAAAAAPRPFSVHDVNQDGYLDRAEYSAFYEEFRERHWRAGRPAHRMLHILDFEEIDDNGDGRISEPEMVTALQQRRQGRGWRWPRSFDSAPGSAP